MTSISFDKYNNIKVITSWSEGHNITWSFAEVDQPADH